MKYTAALLRMLSLSCVLLLSACSSTQGPQYPAQLQMIIAQAASQSVGSEDVDAHQSQSQAISVEQLLANVKASKQNSAKRKVNGSNASNGTAQTKVYGRDSVPDWVFKGESRHQNNMTSNHSNSSANDANDALLKAQALIKTQNHQVTERASLPTMAFKQEAKQEVKQETKKVVLEQPLADQRQIQLQYQAGDDLPHQMQLLMAKKMVAMGQMILVKLVIGTSDESSSFARASTAQRRAKQLINQLQQHDTSKPSEKANEKANEKGIEVEYLPKIGDNIAIVTFQSRGS